MPSSATVTAYYTFVADTKARASEVNNNFNLYRGHLIPIEPLTATSSDILYDLGSREHSWRNLYIKSLVIRSATSTADFTIQGQTSVTAGAGEMLIASTTIATFDLNGITRKSIQNASTRMTTTSIGTGTFGVSGTGASFVDVTNMSLQITVEKHPVEISLFPDNTTAGAQIMCDGQTLALPDFKIRLCRDTTTSIVEGTIYMPASNQMTGMSMAFSPHSFRWVDNPGPGTYTYKLQVSNAGSNNAVYAYYIKMRIREIL